MEDTEKPSAAAADSSKPVCKDIEEGKPCNPDAGCGQDAGQDAEQEHDTKRPDKSAKPVRRPRRGPLRTFLPIFALLVFGIVLGITQIDGFSAENALVFAALCVAGFAISHIPRKEKIPLPWLHDIILLVFSACICFLMSEVAYLPTLEEIFYYDDDPRFLVCVFNVLLILIFMLLGWLLTRRMKRGAQIVLGCVGAISFINSVVYVMRSAPFEPADFLNIGTALSISGDMGVTMPVGLLYSIGLLYLGVAFTDRIVQASKPFMEGKPRSRRIAFATLRTFLVLVLGTGVLLGANVMFNETIVPEQFGYKTVNWSPHRNVKKNGYCAVFLDQLVNMVVIMPSGYSGQAAIDAVALENGLESGLSAEELVEGLSSEISATNSVKPNIIVVQNESLTDFENAYPQGSYTQEVLPFIHSLADDDAALTGTMRVGVFGGGTVTSEWEVLTGTSTWYMKSTAPYQDMAHSNTPSLATKLSAQGYVCEYIHPYEATDYNRSVGVLRIGFEKFWDESFFNASSQAYGDYISDEATYDLVLERIEDLDEPVFIFDNTMQNHYSYERTRYAGDDTDYAAIKLNEFSDVDTFSVYLTRAHESDRAFQELLDEVSKIDEPTIVVLYGDHQARIYDDELKAWLNTAQDGDSALDVQQRAYETPLVIWSNYGLGDGGDIGQISTNYLAAYLLDYAGLESSPYDSFLLKAYEKFPVITKLVYQYSDEIPHAWSEMDELDRLLKEYQYLQYNMLYDHSGYIEEMFSVDGSG